MKERARTRKVRITSDPAVMLGKPVIAGTRITVERIVEEIEAGSSVEELLEDYPLLTRQDIEAALEYAR